MWHIWMQSLIPVAFALPTRPLCKQIYIIEWPRQHHNIVYLCHVQENIAGINSKIFAELSLKAHISFKA